MSGKKHYWGSSFQADLRRWVQLKSITLKMYVLNKRFSITTAQTVFFTLFPPLRSLGRPNLARDPSAMCENTTLELCQNVYYADEQFKMNKNNLYISFFLSHTLTGKIILVSRKFFFFVNSHPRCRWTCCSPDLDKQLIKKKKHHNNLQDVKSWAFANKQTNYYQDMLTVTYCLRLFSDGAHSLQMFCWWTSDVMLKSPNLFWWRNKFIYILDGLRVRRFSAKFHFGWTIHLMYETEFQCIQWKNKWRLQTKKLEFFSALTSLFWGSLISWFS